MDAPQIAWEIDPHSENVLTAINFSRGLPLALVAPNVPVSSVDYLGEFGHGGERDGQFVWPTALAIDQDRRVYLADQYLQRITFFDAEGNTYVAEWRNHRVQKIDPEHRYFGKLAHSF